MTTLNIAITEPTEVRAAALTLSTFPDIFAQLRVAGPGKLKATGTPREMETLQLALGSIFEETHLEDYTIEIIKQKTQDELTDEIDTIIRREMAKLKGEPALVKFRNLVILDPDMRIADAARYMDEDA